MRLSNKPQAGNHLNDWGEMSIMVWFAGCCCLFC